MGKIKNTWHHYTEWECYANGFYSLVNKKGATDELCEKKYIEFFSDLELFEKGILRLFAEWPNSCEHFLTNPHSNRVAWIGQAAICLMWGIPARFKGSYKLLSDEQQYCANALAKKYLDRWIDAHQD